MLRLIRRGMVVIPASGNPEHIKESLDLFGFELTDDLPFIRNYSNCSAPQTRNAAHSSLWVLNSYKLYYFKDITPGDQ